MAGLVPAIPIGDAVPFKRDCRVKPGNDRIENMSILEIDVSDFDKDLSIVGMLRGWAARHAPGSIDAVVMPRATRKHRPSDSKAAKQAREVLNRTRDNFPV
jgi:hypothetical protein